MDSLNENSVPPLCRTSSSRAVRSIKVILSLFIVYHLSAMILLPNAGSVIGRHFTRYFVNYANLLGFNTVWQFFSPAPAATSYLIYQYEFPVHENADIETTRKEEASNPILSYPPKREAGYPWDDFFQRRLYSMRFFMMVPGVLEPDFIPYLCRQNPKAKGIWIQQVFDHVPPMERVEGDSIDELVEHQELPSKEFECPPTSQNGLAEDPSNSGAIESTRGAQGEGESSDRDASGSASDGNRGSTSDVPKADSKGRGRGAAGSKYESGGSQ